ncbi:unnamed protein product [Durusdinium trenchii]|uniref:Uncharacterized protein n=1 Tax=Durusdinium trenchii TaxID=1381693 RepID=A0ABP0JU73_9DINO
MARKRKAKGTCKCGSDLHSSPFEASCPLYIPVDNRPTTTTVCVSANGRFKFPDYRVVIHQAVKTSSMITCRAMWLLHAFFAKLWSERVPLPPVDERLVR